MIELTELQMQAIVASGNNPPVIVDPMTKTPYVLLRQDVYERLTMDEDYDDGLDGRGNGTVGMGDGETCGMVGYGSIRSIPGEKMNRGDALALCEIRLSPAC